MPDALDTRHAIVNALAGFGAKPLPEAALDLLATLGYRSERTVNLSTPAEFLSLLDQEKKTTDKDREALSAISELRLLFQLTDAELILQRELLDDPGAVQTTKIESYLFFAAELPPGHYTRTALSTLVRAINKPLPMPALVLFRHGEAISLGIIHRRLHKRDQAKDVLEKVTLIKDIACADPIRAHVEILNDFALANLTSDYGVHSFVSLHEAWRKRLDSYALSNQFYREIADWYFWAHHQVDDGTIRLPQHCDTEQEKSLFLIRLLTRVIFCWFLVEKRLIPNDLFREHRLKALLKDFSPSRDPRQPDTSPAYYRAVLQNLFFGTLNMPPENRAFREKKKEGQRYDQNYGITNLWRYATTFRDRADWEALAARIPFLNGGLFDCLDDKSGKKKDNFILDGFSDREDFGCHLPNDLFFGPERTVDLSHDYGEEDKRTARSKKAKVRGLIEILSRYKFTIEENTPLEEEIALDPELLGKVFENLLASYNEDTRTTARKALGAFYTPREIVRYMVDEALKSYLSTQVPRCKGALEDLFSNKATLKEIKPDTRDALIAAIGRVKILDPACGSGAFPMGALHRLVDLLQKLDPNNESWKRDRLAEARRYRELLREAGAAKDELAACDTRMADIGKSFDTRYHALDFARKLYLIENCIYGVDIQPIATQIAKLRFFISLIVEQRARDGEADSVRNPQSTIVGSARCPTSRPASSPPTRSSPSRRPRATSSLATSTGSAPSWPTSATSTSTPAAPPPNANGAKPTKPSAPTSPPRWKRAMPYRRKPPASSPPGILTTRTHSRLSSTPSGCSAYRWERSACKAAPPRPFLATLPSSTKPVVRPNSPRHHRRKSKAASTLSSATRPMCGWRRSSTTKIYSAITTSASPDGLISSSISMKVRFDCSAAEASSPSSRPTNISAPRMATRSGDCSPPPRTSSILSTLAMHPSSPRSPTPASSSLRSFQKGESPTAPPPFVRCSGSQDPMSNDSLKSLPPRASGCRSPDW